jgi:hypothetical protein
MIQLFYMILYHVFNYIIYYYYLIFKNIIPKKMKIYQIYLKFYITNYLFEDYIIGMKSEFQS